MILGANAAAHADGEPPGRTRRPAPVRRLSPALLLALVAMLAVWLLSLLLHCYFQAGTFGILTAADRQALPGARRDRRLFPHLQPARLLRLGRALRLAVLRAARPVFGSWRCCWGWRPCSGCSPWRWAAGSGGRGAALGIGCGGALPLGFLALVAGLWFHVAQADLAREGSGVRAASRRGLDVLGRRLGAVTRSVSRLPGSRARARVPVPPAVGRTDSLLAGAPRLRALVRCPPVPAQGFPTPCSRWSWPAPWWPWSAARR